MPSPVSHDASASALGYLYQARWALLELLRGAVEERPDGAISLEMHDDVAWENGHRAVDLLQVKYHQRSVRTLGDKDDDLWRTIRSWMDTHQPGDPDGPWLTLVTTQAARPGSAAAALRGPVRRPDEAQLLLERAARESDAEKSKETRERFLTLSPADRGVFVQRMRVLDGAPLSDDLDEAVRRRLFSLPPGDGPKNAFMRQLWAWWYEQAAAMLQKQITSVSVEQLRGWVEHLRDSFTAATLPTLVGRDDWRAAQDEGVDFGDRCFVHQLRWVDVGRVQLEKAVMDYYRAYTQAVLWVDDHLVAIDDLARYQEDLVDEWERHFDRMKRSLPLDATEQDRQRAGEDLMWRLLDSVTVKIRDRYDEVFFHRGQHHCLADEGRVGWHPEFVERVRALTGSVVHA
ncbi:ABC-three component system protein [Streptomyces sp. NRRL B-24484]|uniref:ABC-three component system protein n=1 Tax=Streptomyces sp. NRRL B-24484 TaxID=1463833 RepID=UPI0004BE79CD|nr:ABC-three component system protein [Streptomyces sp. NRRL B-24484]